MLGEIGKRDVGRAFADHEVDDNQALKDSGPSRVLETILQDAKNLTDTGLVGMRRNEDVLNIFGLWRRQLEEDEVSRGR